MISKSDVGAYARELVLYLTNRMRHPGKKSVLFFTTHGANDASSNLRGYAIADHLRSVGWHAIVCPKHFRLNQRLRLIRRMKPDVIVMQTARHNLNRPSLYPGVPIVFDLDDADYIADWSRPAVLDCLRDSAAVVAGSRTVAAYCRQYNADVSVVWTGTPITPDPYPMHRDREFVVTWPAVSPQTRIDEQDFIFEVISRVSKQRRITFRLYANTGTASYNAVIERFNTLDAKIEALGYLDYQPYLKSFEEVAVGLAPLIDVGGFSGGASFGKILAFLDRGIPTVAHPTADHPLLIENGVNGFLAETAEEWAAAIVRLLDSPEERDRIARDGRVTLEQRLATAVSAGLVERVLDRVLASRDPADGG